MKKIQIPVGSSQFAELRKEGYYYIDKSGLVEEIVEDRSTKVTLITRPRRFGKTLGMSMMAEFFDIRKDSADLFAGLNVFENKELCETWMNCYPTVFVSFKDVDGLNFEKAYARFYSVVEELYNNHYFLLDSDKITPNDKRYFQSILDEKATQIHFENSLRRLTAMLSAHYGKPVILLIDEYDVPLAKANANGYYREMLSTVRGIMSALKDNDALKLAVITGCLQIARESIFTGTNNFVTNTISDDRLNEYFGFTQDEVDRLLRDTQLDEHTNAIREWYDGYHFGNRDIYCPWDVMCYVNALQYDSKKKPDTYWENTSHNDIIYQFVSTTEADVNEEFETLIAGGYIVESIEKNLTYDVMYASEQSIWTLLYYTGYLTKVRENDIEEVPAEGEVALTIPNREIRDVFRKSVRQWYDSRIQSSDREELFAAMWNGEAQKFQTLINDILFDTISYHDYQESFYHAFICGFLARAGYKVESNYEAGLGRSDITVKDRRNRRAVVIEAKIADKADRLEAECDDALKQIDDKKYAVAIKRSGYKKVTSYGIAFYQKQCKVKKA